MENLEATLTTYSLSVLAVGTFFLVLFAAISLKKKKLSASAKKTLFLAIAASAIVPTLVMAVTTIYLNMISSSNGPVHWHADFEIYACGQELELKDPTGLSNKIGTATLHEHNDKRVHLEGVVVEPDDASLGEFFQVIGGELTQNSVTIPTTTDILTYTTGDACGTAAGSLQVFVYQVNDEGYYSQQKLSDPASYIISPQSNIPPGDCVIVEFDTPKEQTEKLCRSYQVAEELGKIQKKHYEY